ncbi:MAG: hypothetical protein QF405_09010 [Roseibacillus sp.]|jgi:hypothetical protein|nr:hypothetical protein [Roseibacillus sp.]MCP4728906.1 hypothetical protein [Roseibacillus sp.]MDP7307763.1 hypothetical protein [Roseibacillus sp.]MDP7655729.1 hypothetical protein [Roseibacillus sp.]HJM65602.1 hypothetical protein [Roseibacillus sp.]|tara:strand:- start:7334 stop:7942 length:609 start_codon:yes stop_codon:yes gene_type:complete
MKTEPSDKHEGLKALLAQSFRSEEADDVPSLPEDLRDRIRSQYGKDLAPAPTPTEERSESIFTRISRLFAQPQFSGSLAAVALIAVAAFLLMPDRTDPPNGGMRGNDQEVPANPTATIILYGFEPAAADTIKAVLDPAVASIRQDISGEPAAEGITIIIDGKAGKIEGYANPDAEATTVQLPDNEFEVGKAVSELLKQLSRE